MSRKVAHDGDIEGVGAGGRGGEQYPESAGIRDSLDSGHRGQGRDRQFASDQRAASITREDHGIRLSGFQCPGHTDEETVGQRGEHQHQEHDEGNRTDDRDPAAATSQHLGKGEPHQLAPRAASAGSARDAAD